MLLFVCQLPLAARVALVARVVCVARVAIVVTVMFVGPCDPCPCVPAFPLPRFVVLPLSCFLVKLHPRCLVGVRAGCYCWCYC